MATGIGEGRGRKQGDKEGPGPRYCAPSAPTAATSPLLHTTGASAFHLSLPPSLCPAAEALQLSSTPRCSGLQAGRETSKVQMHTRALAVLIAGLQRLVTFLFQVTVVVLLGR